MIHPIGETFELFIQATKKTERGKKRDDIKLSIPDTFDA